ncbi:preprotein translocase subunit YajC [Corynebacterium halotolerans]|uniref:Preprotein translocase subunit YajC-like protein n=1 Tax=Corynebacterium halotolerans YIM 70093 = DSM 44683 TaxID=1121362 RepID=M1NT24_9CORY|nr:preprotein translocase subunit YajC [Corynebacterium halotolerans]AGF72617.1 preprotein translocase subunit YajC-like protein [Corynebacterium halotolerans YIM 70093 = DSM 44683]
MDLILILILLAVFLLPSFFMMRNQRKRQAEIQTLQNSLNIGDRVVTAAGLHGTVAGIRETEVDLELSPGVEVTMEKMAVVRHATPAGEVPGAPGQLGQSGQPGEAQPGMYPDRYNDGHPENPQNPGNPDERGDYGHPENPR